MYLGFKFYFKLIVNFPDSHDFEYITGFLSTWRLVLAFIWLVMLADRIRVYMWDSTSVGEENESLHIRVWKPFSNRRIFKPWGWRRYVMGQSGQYLLTVDLGCYKWYQGQTPSGMLARTLDPKWGGLWDPTSVGEWNEVLLIRVWKPLSSIRIFKPWDWRRCVMSQSEQYFLAIDLGCYKWYQG